MRIWLILFLSYYVAIVQGQTVITGTAKSADDSKPLAGLSITIKPKASANLLTYALTDHKGSYQLTFKSPADSVVITLSGLNVKKQVAIYANKSRSLHFSVTHEDIVLKEVKVKPPAIRRLDDTLNYAVDHFTGKNDRTIGEVLRKMPGIKIADDGSISYNDKAINRFYIDDHDLLQGRYNLATNNLEAKDVETVQVLENHQPIKALKDKDFSEQAAINLKLKDNAKNVLTANTQVGAGVAPVLWNNELFAMFFGKGKQFMGTYKGNNTGDDSAGDLNNFYVGGWNFGFPVCLGIQSPSGPGVGRKRYLLNRDNAVSLNGLRAYGKDYKLTANVSYASDHQQKDSYSRAENYLPGDSTLVIEERMKATERFHYLDAAVKLNANTPQFYFDNALKFSGDLQRDEYGSVENSQFITQNRSAPYIRLINDFSMIKNYKKLTLKISSYNGYGRINDNLNIQPLLYPALFSDHGTITGMQQSLKQQTFVSYNNVGFGLNHGRFRQNYSAGAGMSLLNLNSALSGELESGRLGNTADTLSNSLKWNRYDLSLSPEYTYKDKKLIVNLKLPLNNITQHSNDDILGVSKNMNRLFFNPSLSIDYKLNLLWTLYGSAAYSQNIDGAENGYTGYIMRSYRYLVHNEGQLPESSSRSYNMSIKYAHPIDMVFASFGGGYYRSKMNLLYGNVFNG
ncbi:MAG TPA: hypothetical protein VKB19_05570, partial [Pedobacter sp.]|nr:hypothetical protein [Pedobacter sp.]